MKRNGRYTIYLIKSSKFVFLFDNFADSKTRNNISQLLIVGQDVPNSIKVGFNSNFGLNSTRIPSKLFYLNKDTVFRQWLCLIIWRNNPVIVNVKINIILLLVCGSIGVRVKRAGPEFGEKKPGTGSWEEKRGDGFVGGWWVEKEAGGGGERREYDGGNSS